MIIDILSICVKSIYLILRRSTNDPEVYEVANSSHIHGMGKNRYEYDRIGMNARISTIQAAILIEKLKIFPE